MKPTLPPATLTNLELTAAALTPEGVPITAALIREATILGVEATAAAGAAAATSRYPEHDKLQALGKAPELIGDFLEWLQYEAKVVLAQYSPTHDEAFPWNKDIETIQAMYFGIDRAKLDAEKRQMLEGIRYGVR